MGKGKGDWREGKGRDEEANRALPIPSGPPVMKAPAKPSNPAPIMKPPPNQHDGPMDMVPVQPTQRP
eukprot:943543-Amphidinium_carterae.1